MKYSTDQMMMTLFLREVLGPLQIDKEEALKTILKNIPNYIATIPIQSLGTKDLDIKAETILFVLPCVKTLLESIPEHTTRTKSLETLCSLFFDTSYSSVLDTRLIKTIASDIPAFSTLLNMIKIHRYKHYFMYHTTLFEEEPGLTKPLERLIRVDPTRDNIQTQKLKNHIRELEFYAQQIKTPADLFVYKTTVTIFGPVVDLLDEAPESLRCTHLIRAQKSQSQLQTSRAYQERNPH